MMFNFGPPLKEIVSRLLAVLGAPRAFAFTLSKLGGDTTEKQIKKTSVWGYERGRKRS